MDEHDLLTSQKTACMMKDDQLHNMVTSSPTIKNTLYKVYERTKLRPDMTKERAILETERCLVTRQHKMFYLLCSTNFVFIGERLMANLCLAAASMIEGIFKAAWLNERTIYEYRQVRKTGNHKF